MFFLLLLENEVLELNGKVVFHKKGSGYVSFQEARTQCASYGGKIISIHSMEENNRIYDWMRDIYTDTRDYWLGFHRKGSAEEFQWEDGSRVQFTNWEEWYPRLSSNYAFVTSLGGTWYSTHDADT